jgi:predicted ribosomally synthesized peptide with nif11-like leader
LILQMTTTRPFTPMSEEQLKAFWEAVQADAGLQEKLSAAKDADAVVAIAKPAGFEISVEEVAKAQAELSDEQLSGVAGGAASASIADADEQLWILAGWKPMDELGKPIAPA